MPGLVPGIHVLICNSFGENKTWMAGTSPAMTPRGLPDASAAGGVGAAGAAALAARRSSHSDGEAGDAVFLHFDIAEDRQLAALDFALQFAGTDLLPQQGIAV